ncbi:MAG: signal peptide peptidase SppA [Pseudomonadota bacterium]
MSAEDSNMTVWGFIKGFGKLMIGILLLVQGLIGLAVMLMFVAVLVSVSNGVAGGDETVSVSVPNDSALVIDPNGVLVEIAEDVDPFQLIIEEAYGIDQPGQIEVHDIVQVIREAKDDKRIKGLVLDLGNLQIPSSSASKAHYIADEISKFKESGKEVVAVGDFYSQEQYIIAANADKIFMNDYGNVLVFGYGRYNIFFKSLFEKLKITSHVFRVGTFKSAIEPFIRDDMSPEAKEANRAYLSVLWREYMASVEKARGLDQGAISRYANDFSSILREADGSFAHAALDFGLVDELKSRAEQNKYLTEKFGAARDNEDVFKNVSYRRYLTSLDQNKDGSAPNVAVITAAGAIVDGEAPIGQAAGGDTVAALLKKARKDDDVKAVVLRVDSPGGSAFASDIIRDEILAIKKAGKPVVASMGSLAASGGYWIAAPADEIWAAPTTITGSIGIFGFFQTFENSAAEIGVYTDGVGTTDLAGIFATPIGPLPDAASDIIQQSVEYGYDRFLTVVGEGRSLDKEYVDSVGQGRVWIGERAKELRLVDQLGGFDQAVAAAAERAGLETYDVVEMVERRTPFERFFGTMAMAAAKVTGFEGRAKARAGVVGKLMAIADEKARFFEQFNDPNAVYARCLACE